MYLDAAEYAVLATLPATSLHTKRLSIPPLGVDVFDGALTGLVLAEVEFIDDEAMVAFVAPREAVAEVTDDQRLTGGRLAGMPGSDLADVLAEYGVGDYAR